MVYGIPLFYLLEACFSYFNENLNNGFRVCVCVCVCVCASALPLINILINRFYLLWRLQCLICCLLLSMNSEVRLSYYGLTLQSSNNAVEFVSFQTEVFPQLYCMICFSQSW
uniref:Uncharacterized protein n=1 Tax=Parascaris univalens TaxID=6257 RepID=A0A915ARX6_PARUN